MTTGRRPDRSRVSPEDANLFIATVADAKPLRRKKKQITAHSTATALVKPKSRPVGGAATVKATPSQSRSHPGHLHDMDHRTAERFRRGQMTIEARVDLHGQTRDAALSRLVRFLQRSSAAGKRCVLVITGKGTGGAGVLRREFPLWLETQDLRPLILGMAPSQAKDGGSGAFYVLLRRNR